MWGIISENYLILNIKEKMAEEDTSPPPTPDLVDLDSGDEEEDIVAATEAAAAAIASFSQRKGAPKLEDRRAKHNRTSQKWSTEEKQKLLLGQRALGSEPTRWVLISKLLLPGRSATALSNLWRSDRYQREIERGEEWTYSIPLEVEQYVQTAVRKHRAESKKKGGQATHTTHDQEEEEDQDEEEPKVTADFLTEAIGMFQPSEQTAGPIVTNLPTTFPSPTVAAEVPIELPVLKKRKGATPPTKVSFASSCFTEKSPAGTALDSDILSTPNLYPNLTLSAIGSIPGSIIVTQKEFSQYAHEQVVLSEWRASIVSGRQAPAQPRPILPDPYHPLSYFRLPSHLPEGQPADPTLQTEFHLYNPLGNHPFDQELEDAQWCGGGEK